LDREEVALMAYFRFNSGATSEVDDDELRELIKAGAGTEVDAPNAAPAGAQRVTAEDGAPLIDSIVQGKNRSLDARVAKALSGTIKDSDMPSGTGYPFAPNSPNILRRGYQGARDVLSVPFAGLEAGVSSVANSIPKVSKFVNGVVGSEGESNFFKNYDYAYGKRNEGLRSFGNDPINAALLASNFVPGLGFLTDPIAATRLGKYGSLAANITKDVALGAGTGAAQSMLDENSYASPGEGAFIGAATGGLGAGVGEFFRARGRDLIPGIGKKHNLNVPEEAKELYRQNADAVLSQGFFPKGREGFLAIGEGLQNRASKRYQAGMDALESAKPDLRFSVAEWDRRARERAIESMGSFLEPGLVEDATPLGYRLNDLVGGIFDTKMGAVRASTLKHTPRAWQYPEGQQYFDEAAMLAENERLKDILTPTQFSKSRTGTTDPIAWKNPDAEVSRYKRKAYLAMHDAANDMLMEHPEYSDALGIPSATDQVFRRGNAPQQFKLGGTIENITNSPGAIGLSHRMPITNFAIDPWLWGSTNYKIGQAVDNAGIVPVATGISNLWQGLAGGIPNREQGGQAR
jgi:hypothetical protein